MDIVRIVVACFLLTVMYTCGLILAFGSLSEVRIDPSPLMIDKGDDIVFTIQSEVNTGADFSWYIDGQALLGVHTPSLQVGWEEYVTMFPYEEDIDIKEVSVVVEENGEIREGVSQLIIGAPKISVCGNGVIELGEECDDTNRVSNDGCSVMCLCEGFCPELLTNGISL